MLKLKQSIHIISVCWSNLKMTNLLIYILPVLTILISFISIFIAIRNELKKNIDTVINSKLSDEKRHSNHENRLAIIEQKLQNLENSIHSRLESIEKRLTDIYDLFIDHIKERHL